MALKICNVSGTACYTCSSEDSKDCDKITDKVKPNSDKKCFTLTGTGIVLICYFTRLNVSTPRLVNVIAELASNVHSYTVVLFYSSFDESNRCQSLEFGLSD